MSLQQNSLSIVALLEKADFSVPSSTTFHANIRIPPSFVKLQSAWCLPAGRQAPCAKSKETLNNYIADHLSDNYL
jgi:hypothetical protein